MLPRLFLRLALALALLLSVSAGMAATVSGMVVDVTSGDTIKVRDAAGRQHVVRLTGVDAPEKFQQYGQRALDSLRALVFRRHVTVEMHSGGNGKVVSEGRDVGMEQLQRGMVWYYAGRAGGLTAEQREAYAAAQAQAKQLRTGLWRDNKPIPPWEFRQGRRK